MDQPDVSTRRITDSRPHSGAAGTIKAAHRYEVVQPPGPGLAGRRFHFIGAGGIGMSGLAQLLVKNNAVVSGSDQADGPTIDVLRGVGADIRISHSGGNLDPQTDAVVISAAIKEDNPELQLARRRGCRVYKYAEMLGELMNRYEAIAVSGTHGKSTTSGWVTYLLKRAGIDASFIVGAEICQLGVSAGVGDSRYFVAEACEYDRSFLNLNPRIACILNVEQDHLDYYRDEDEIVEAFAEFARGIRPDGVLIVNGQDANAANIARDVTVCAGDKHIRCESFGLDSSCNFYAQNLREVGGLCAFDVYHSGRLLGPARISLAGRHNVLNALAVVAIAVNTGLEPGRALRLLGEFTGMDRRLMLKGRLNGITVLDDYAHHPTEIKATLEAIRARYAPSRLWCVFQPHQYSRTRFLLDDFAESFKLADVTIVPEIYFVRDSLDSKKQVSSQMLVERIRGTGSEAVFIDGFDAICEFLKDGIGPGELVVTMGAGDIWKVADEYIRWLGRNS